MEFLKGASQQKVQEIMHACYQQRELHLITENIEVQCPPYAYLLKMKRGWKLTIKKIMTSSLRTIYPSFLVKKFGNVISQGQMMEIWERWKGFLKTGVKPSQKKNMGRGKTAAFHFGVWRRYQAAPFITKDSRNIASNPLVDIIRKTIARKIVTFTENYSPSLWSKQKT
jgi:hypothetical protein